MRRLFGLALAAALLLGAAAKSEAQVGVSVGQPYYGNGLGVNPYGYAVAPGFGYSGYGTYGPGFGYGTSSYYSSTSVLQPYGGFSSFGSAYGSPYSNFYSRGYSGIGYGSTLGAYGPYGGYASPNYGGYGYGYGFGPGVTIMGPRGGGMHIGR